MNEHDEQFDVLLEAKLAGRAADIPPTMAVDLDHAALAHHQLHALLDETLAPSIDGENHVFPSLGEHFSILRELGRGGMGVVYLAHQKSLDRNVAVKVLRPHQRTLSALVKRFLDEAQHLARLRHPNIVSIHDVGTASGEPYFTMDFIDGQPLSQLLRKGALAPTAAIEVVKQVAEAIAHAHRQGIIHRDLKPANVLLDSSGHAFVSDFGLARNLSSDASLTQSGELLGTPQYMSPEQARGQSSLVGEATDIHAIGLLLFETLTGRPAFGATSPADVMVKLLSEEPPPLRSIDKRIPRDLETICLKALQKNPADRYANVSALVEDLHRYERGEPLLARRMSLLRRATHHAKKHWKTGLILSLVAMLIAALLTNFDGRTTEELVTWGSEELASGNSAMASDIFARAWKGASIDERQSMAPTFASAIAKVDDTKRAIQLALQVVEVNPNLSFDRHDFLVAQSLAMEARALTGTGVFEPVHNTKVSEEELAKRQLAARRLSIFLDGPFGNDREREEAEATLRAIERSMQGLVRIQEPLQATTTTLPSGNLEQLQKLSSHTLRPLWEQGKTEIAIAQHYQQAGDNAQALLHFERALALIRRVYPFVRGVRSSEQLSRGEQDPLEADAPECRFLRDLLASIKQFSPSANLAPTTLHITTSEPRLLDELRVSIAIELVAVDTTDLDRNFATNLSCYVPLRSAAGEKLEVLPGTYRLRLASTLKSYDGSSPLDPALLDITSEQWPTEITIGNDPITLPPIVLRKLAQISITTPQPSAPMNLATDRITWSAVAGATQYRIHFGSFSDKPLPTSNWFVMESTTRSELTLSESSQATLRAAREHWKKGLRGGIRIEAFDADMHRIGTTVGDHPFLIADELQSQ